VTGCFRLVELDARRPIVNVPPEAMASRAFPARFMITCRADPVDQNSGQVRVQLGDEVDLFAEQAPEEANCLLHHDVQVDQRGAQDLLPAESEQLMCESGRTLGRIVDLDEIVARPVVERPLQDDGAVAADDQQQVVEVVRDTPASCPIASSRCDWRSCSSRLFVPETSRTIPTKNRSWSNSNSVTARSIGKVEPSFRSL